MNRYIYKFLRGEYDAEIYIHTNALSFKGNCVLDISTLDKAPECWDLRSEKRKYARYASFLYKEDEKRWIVCTGAHELIRTSGYSNESFEIDSTIELIDCSGKYVITKGLIAPYSSIPFEFRKFFNLIEVEPTEDEKEIIGLLEKYDVYKNIYCNEANYKRLFEPERFIKSYRRYTMNDIEYIDIQSYDWVYLRDELENHLIANGLEYDDFYKDCYGNSINEKGREPYTIVLRCTDSLICAIRPLLDKCVKITDSSDNQKGDE